MSRARPPDLDPRPLTPCRRSSLYAATVVGYSFKENKVVRTISFDNVSGNPLLHTSGIALDANAGAAFDTRGEDTAGDNNVIEYDLKAGRVAWTKNLSPVSPGDYRGFQDVVFGDGGDFFAISSFGGSLWRLGPGGRDAEAWGFGAPKAFGFSGVVKLDADTLLVTDNNDSSIHRWGIARANQSAKVDVAGGLDGLYFDGAFLPPRYHGRVLLVSVQANGTAVLESSDGWKMAEMRGLVPNRLTDDQAVTTFSFEAGDHIFVNYMWFLDNGGTKAGDRRQFPMDDVTDRVDELVSHKEGDRPDNVRSGSSRTVLSLAALAVGLAVALM